MEGDCHAGGTTEGCTPRKSDRRHAPRSGDPQLGQLWRTLVVEAYDGRVETRPDTGPSAGGYVIVLLGVAGFVVGCFLPYLGGVILAPGEDSASLIRLLWTPAEGPLEQVAPC